MCQQNIIWQQRMWVIKELYKSVGLVLYHDLKKKFKKGQGKNRDYG